MTSVLFPWLLLAACAMLIMYAGSALTHYAEVISNLAGLPRSWVGMVLLATATSLPELFTGISSVSVANVPNIALGDALGSCIFNMVMLVVLDALSRDEPVYLRIDQGHVLTAGFGVILIGLVGSLIVASPGEFGFTFAHVSAFTPLLILLYLVATRATFTYERRLMAPPEPPQADEALGLRGAALRYAGTAIVVGLAGALLPFAGSQIAETTGWQTSFVGTLFIAAATSLPEAVVTIAALRRNAADLAIATLLGSNLFNMLIIAIDDLAYRQGSLFAAVSPAHVATAFAGMIMSGIFIVTLLYRPANRFFGIIGWAGLGLSSVYLLSSYFIYLHGH